MTSPIVSVSQTELAQRRRQLRRQRRVKLLQRTWRVLAIGGIASGLMTVVTSPNWVLHRPEQVHIQGNQFVKEDRVRALLPIRYPQSLLKLEPKVVAAGLKAKMPLAEVTVNRHLFPPGLTVQLAERQPVAIAVPGVTDPQPEAAEPTPESAPAAASRDRGTASSSNGARSLQSTERPGLLDESGNWIPLDSYMAIDQSLKLPQLRVVGRLDHYHAAWVKFYREVSQSPLKISEIDWRDPTNLILKTELGIVYFGPYSPQFGYQLSLLDRMRKLPNQVNVKDLAFIDLRNPATPTLQAAHQSEEN